EARAGRDRRHRGDLRRGTRGAGGARGGGRQGAQPDGCPRAQRDQATRLRDRQRQGGIRIGEVLRFATVLRLDEELGLEEIRLLEDVDLLEAGQEVSLIRTAGAGPRPSPGPAGGYPGGSGTPEPEGYGDVLHSASIRPPAAPPD